MVEHKIIALTEVNKHILDEYYDRVMPSIKEELKMQIVGLLDIVPKRVEWTEELCKQHGIHYHYGSNGLVAQTDRVIFSAQVIVKI